MRATNIELPVFQKLKMRFGLTMFTGTSRAKGLRPGLSIVAIGICASALTIMAITIFAAALGTVTQS